SRTSSSFFFQAEDGIRDLTVTGVQTCALPILLVVAGKVRAGVVVEARRDRDRLVLVERVEVDARLALDLRLDVADPLGVGRQVRSEERRVGKEWRCRRGR